MSIDTERERRTRELVHYCTARPSGDDRFEAEGPDWYGPRVFGGVLVAQALSAAMQTVQDRSPHSMHGYFLRPEKPGAPVGLTVERIRDGRTFSTRRVTMRQDGKDLCHVSCSFHGDDVGPDYQMPMPADVPPPGPVDGDWGNMPAFEMVHLGPTQQAEDGSYESTSRVWIRSVGLDEDPHTHACLAAFLSDMTGTSFRPLSMDVWGHDSDASIDHAVWFHRPVRLDDWLLFDFQALVNHGGRSTVRGRMFTQYGKLCMSMAQELLIRPLGEPN